MNLSEFIRYRNQLESMTAWTAESMADAELRKIISTVKLCPIPFEDNLSVLEHQRLNLIESYRHFDSALTELKQKINFVIDEQGEAWFIESHKRYNFEIDNQTIESFLNKKTSIPDNDRDYFVARLNTYASWKHPGLILRPGQHNFIHSMVCFDPLYIVDRHDDLLWPCQIEFPDQYRKRLRPVVINEDSSESLASLPDAQFGVGLAFDYFNFLPFHVVVYFLEQVYTKLKPGGVFCITFNDCDTEKGMKLVEMFQASYIPQRKIMYYIEKIGYEVVHKYNNDSPLTWLELKKPGELNSNRGGQVLAAVRPKPQQN